jgi:hypothetical protein
MAGPRRKLTDGEKLVLLEIQIHWGPQNTAENVFFSDRGDAVLFVRAKDGSNPGAIVLTTLAGWFQKGTLSIEQLRAHIKGPDALIP